MTAPTEFKYNTLLSSIIIACTMCAAILGATKIIIVPGHPILCAIIPFCIAFMLIDVFTNQYGFVQSKRLVNAIIASKLFMVIMFELAIVFPTATYLQSDLEFKQHLHTLIRSLYSGAFATFMAFNLNYRVFSNLILRFDGRHLWLRCIIATTVSELVYSICSNFIFLFGNVSFNEIMLLSFNNFGFKFFFEVVTLPLTYLLVYCIDRFETITKIRCTNFRPQLS